MQNRILRAFIVVVSLAAVLPGAAGPVFAHGNDPLESAPGAPSAEAAVEVASGELKEVLVEDRVAGATVRYQWLALPDGTTLALRGASVERLAKGIQVEVTGRRNGMTLFATDARVVPGRASGRPASKASGQAEAEGELRIVHVDDLDEAKSRFEFEVRNARGEITPLDLGIRPEALQRGMRVVVKGPARADGTIEPDTIAITALPATPPPDKAFEKAAVTNKVLVILMRFTDSGAPPFTQAQVQATFAGGPGSGSVAEYFKEASYGQQLLGATVTPWLSTGSATPSGCDWRAMGTIGRNAATAAGYNLASYQNLVYVFPKVPGCGWSGLAYIGASGAWINGRNTLLVYGHELGHNFGLLHAGSLDCGTASVGGACSASEYGDPFGIMGNQRAMHFNATQKSILGWIAAGTVKTHSAGSATYVLNPIETAGGAAYAVKVKGATNRTYWLEYRQPVGFDAGLVSYPNNGAQVRVATPFETLCGGCDSRSDDTQMLDMTPATSTFTDATLLAGRSWTDNAYGITFNVLSATPTALTLQVVSAGAVTTTTALATSRNPSTAGTSVTFTATVTGTAPTGTVAFTANGTTLTACGNVLLAGSGNTRTAACTSATLAAGSHAIVARYGGDAGNGPSTSATLTQTVTASTPAGTNVALASAGASATASSTFNAGFAVSGIINDERAGANWGEGTAGWKDATSNAWPDWVQVNFAGSKTIDRIVLFSVQDNYTAPVEPTDSMSFSAWGVRDFAVQGWNGSSWVTLATVTGNNLVKRTVTFAPYTTDRIRINVTSAFGGLSRLTELQAWGTSASTTPPKVNVALIGAGATASASSTYSAGFPASGVINGELAGWNWGGGSGGWKDATDNAWPDWVQVGFAGKRTVDRVVVFSVQDDFESPAEPTDTMTFTRWGLRDFTVQGWNGTSWVTLATVTSNNLVKRTVTFVPYATERIRINVTSAVNSLSRITEVQAWGS